MAACHICGYSDLTGEHAETRFVGSQKVCSRTKKDTTYRYYMLCVYFDIDFYYTDIQRISEIYSYMYINKYIYIQNQSKL